MGKTNVLYSDNPKMDKSGITVKKPVYGYTGSRVDSKTVTGGKIYMEAVREREDFSKKASMTDKSTLRRAGTYVAQGYSCDHAVDIAQREPQDAPGVTVVISSGSED